MTAISISGLQAVNTSQVGMHLIAIHTAHPLGFQPKRTSAAGRRWVDGYPSECAEFPSAQSAHFTLQAKSREREARQYHLFCTLALQAGRYSITYSASDRAGNVATASQAVVVQSPCSAPERLCLSSCTCSSFG